MAPPLPPRTAEILELLLAGVDRPAIAAQLRLSRFTVKNHIRVLLHRWHAPTTAVLVATVWLERATALREENARLRATLAVLDRRRG